MTIIERLLAWVRTEVRLMTADNWKREDMRVEPASRPCSSEDPRCAETIRRLAECRERMRRMRSGLLDDPNRRFTDSASTDVAATIHKARTMNVGPVRAVLARKAR